MTAIVGILCKRGIVIASDSSCTFCSGEKPTIEQKTNKVHIINNGIIFAASGDVGLIQRMVDNINKVMKENGECSALDLCRAISNKCIDDFNSTGLGSRYTVRSKYNITALLALSSKGRHYLCEFSDDLQPTMREFPLWFEPSPVFFKYKNNKASATEALLFFSASSLYSARAVL